MKHVTLTIPTDDPNALRAGATMLLTLAGASVPGVEVVDSAPLAHAPGAAAPEEPERPAGHGVHIDDDGLPWDARIHSSTKSLTADNRWRKKRGIDDSTIAQVEGELRALMAIPLASVPGALEVTEADDDDDIPTFIPSAFPPVIDPVATAVPPVPEQVAVPVPPPAPAAAPSAAPPVPALVTPPPAASGEAMTFGDFLKRVSTKVQVDKTITVEGVTTILNKHGIKNMQLAGARLDLLPMLWAEIDAYRAA